MVSSYGKQGLSWPGCIFEISLVSSCLGLLRECIFLSRLTLYVSFDFWSRLCGNWDFLLVGPGLSFSEFLVICLRGGYAGWLYIWGGDGAFMASGITGRRLLAGEAGPGRLVR